MYVGTTEIMTFKKYQLTNQLKNYIFVKCGREHNSLDIIRQRKIFPFT